MRIVAAPPGLTFSEGVAAKVLGEGESVFGFCYCARAHFSVLRCWSVVERDAGTKRGEMERSWSERVGQRDEMIRTLCAL